MIPRGRVYRYPPGRNMSDMSMGGAPGGMLSGPYNMGGMPFREAPFAQPMSTGALASALANATPDQQRTVSLCLFNAIGPSKCITCVVFLFHWCLTMFLCQSSHRPKLVNVESRHHPVVC